MENPFGCRFALAFSQDEVHFTQLSSFYASKKPLSACDAFTKPATKRILLIFLGASHFPSDSINTGYHSKFLVNLSFFI